MAFISCNTPTRMSPSSWLDRQIGQRLKIFRKHHGMSRAELADKIEAHGGEHAIRNFEDGVVPVSVASLRQIADALYMPIYCFLEDDAFDEWVQDLNFFTAYGELAPPVKIRLRQLVLHIAGDRAILDGD